MSKLICALLLGTAGIAGTIETFEYSTDNLRIDAAAGSIDYAGLDVIADPSQPAVVVDKYFYHSPEITVAGTLSFRVIKADTMSLDFQPVLSAPDLPTADFGSNARQIPIFPENSGCYPASPVRMDRNILGNCTVWSVQVFPVQYLADNRIVFNRLIEITNDSDASPAPVYCGLPELDHNSRNLPPSVLGQSAGNGCPLGQELVVITSPELAEAFEPFMKLKVQTGFDAALVVTDTVFAWYDGLDRAEALRNYLRDFYLAGGRYVILGGDEDHVPIRYAYYYNTDDTPTLDQLMVCDLYFADYDGDWDYDGDGVWGEPTQDHPDQGAEVSLGRLPFSDPAQVTVYTEKLRTYLFDPGHGDRAYLNRSVFFTSDQMRDYFEGGQQYEVARSFPDGYAVDCERLAESPTGLDPAPTGPLPSDVTHGLDDGYGMVNILAHGRPDAFVIKSSEYNLFPKTYMLTGPENAGGLRFACLPKNQKTAFYYSISCSQGAIDLETVYAMTVPSVVEDLLALDSAGAVGMVAFSRWGWVGSSYKLMAAFYSHLFDDADGYPAAAMNLSYLDYPYYRDQIYGQNFYGDPSIKVYRDLPAQAIIDAPATYEPFQPPVFSVTLNGEPLIDHPVVVMIDDTYHETVFTDGNGFATADLPSNCSGTVSLTVYTPAAVSACETLTLSLTADTDDDPFPLPHEFELNQNYPNPFNPSTTISFSLSRSGNANLRIYDILGRVVDEPVDGYLEAGKHNITWYGTDRYGQTIASGIYFYRLTADEGIMTRKMVLVK